MQYSGQKSRCPDQYPESHSAIGPIPGPPYCSRHHDFLQGPLCPYRCNRKRQGCRNQWVWSRGCGIPNSTLITGPMFVKCKHEMRVTGHTHQWPHPSQSLAANHLTLTCGHKAKSTNPRQRTCHLYIYVFVDRETTV